MAVVFGDRVLGPMLLDVALPLGRKLYLNDFVHSFCYRARHPEANDHTQWIWLLHGNWRPQLETEYNNGYVGDYSAFIAYAIKFTRTGIRSFNTLICYLSYDTGNWRKEDFEYADYLLNKYYLGKDKIHG